MLIFVDYNIKNLCTIGSCTLLKIKEDMKRNYIYIIGFIAVLTAFSCSKERGPRLTVYVQEANGTPAVGATVHAWPGNDPNKGVIDEEMDQTGTTDGAGNVVFDFKASAVLDVDVKYYKSTVDGAGLPITDTLSGSKVTKIEAVRQSSSENNFNETVVVK